MNTFIQILTESFIERLEVIIPLIVSSIVAIIGAISGVIVKYRKTKKMDIGTIFKAVEKEKATFDKIKTLFKDSNKSTPTTPNKKTKDTDKSDERT